MVLGWMLRRRAKSWLRDNEAKMGLVVYDKDGFAHIADDWVVQKSSRGFLAPDYKQPGPVYEAMVNALAIHAKVNEGRVIVTNEELLANNLLVADQMIGASPWASLALLAAVCSRETCEKFIEAANLDPERAGSYVKGW